MRTLRELRSLGSFVVIVSLVACGGDVEVGADNGSTSSTGSSDAALLAAVGQACDATHACPSGTVCGTCGIATAACTIACSHSGSGAEAGCPDGAYCSLAWYQNTQVHVCVRLCQTDSDCKSPTQNDTLSCNDSTNDDGTTGPTICNVPNSTAAVCQ